MYNEYFTYATNQLYIMLSFLFNAMTIPSFSLVSLNMATIQLVF